jgi:Na+-transporting NADH:ubiquinone oxidoreductase subunit NqrF
MMKRSILMMKRLILMMKRLILMMKRSLLINIDDEKINIDDEEQSMSVCITEDVLCHKEADVSATHCHRQLYDDVIMAYTPICHP